MSNFLSLQLTIHLGCTYMSWRRLQRAGLVSVMMIREGFDGAQRVYLHQSMNYRSLSVSALFVA